MRPHADIILSSILSRFLFASTAHVSRPFRQHTKTKQINHVRSQRKPDFSLTSESVNEGHPDKLCDQVSDAIVDACFAQDENSHVAAETCTGTGFVMVFGEVTTNAKFDYEEVVRNAIKEIGFDAPEKGLDYKTCKVLNNIQIFPSC